MKASSPTAAATPVFIPPTPEQIRDQPASVTAAQVLTQRLNLDDPATRAELERVLKTSAVTRKMMAWDRAKKMGIPTNGDTPGGGNFELQDFDGDQPVYHMTKNLNAAISTTADKVRYSDPMFYVDGGGDTIGIWEPQGVPLVTHEEFSVSNISRVVPAAGQLLSSTDHATHVAATMMGSGATVVPGEKLHALMGMAPAATLSAYDSTDDLGEMVLAGATQSNQLGRLMVSNHSYGPEYGWWAFLSGGTPTYVWRGTFIPNDTDADDIDTRFGQYDSGSTAIDGLLANTTYYLPFFAAGNDRSDGPPPAGSPWYLQNTSGTPGSYIVGRHPRGDGAYKNGFDNLTGSGAVAKNTFTVGAVEDAVDYGARNTTQAAMTSFSSWGPADDGRIKPDIVANGYQVLSATNTANNASAAFSGTSQATPNACGSALLLQQIYRNQNGGTLRADQLKALIIHTADDLGNPGPDYKTGWGLMNTRRAADAIEGTGTQILTGQLSIAQQSEIYTADVTGGNSLRVTLCWTDPAGAADTAHDDHTPDLVNDLNLVITGPTGVTYLPYVMPYVGQWTQATLDQPATFGVNHTDNVEQVCIPVPAAGVYTVAVSKTGNLALPGFQDYALIIGGEPPPDIAVSPAAVTFECVCCGNTSQQVPVTIRNTGLGMLRNLSAVIEGANAASFTIEPLAATQLNPGDSMNVMVTYNAPASGTHSATLRIVSSDPDEGQLTIPLGASEYSSTVTLGGTVPIAPSASQASFVPASITSGSTLAVATIDWIDLDEYGLPQPSSPTNVRLATYRNDGSGSSLHEHWRKTIPGASGQTTTDARLAVNAAGTRLVLQQSLLKPRTPYTVGDAYWASSFKVYDLESAGELWTKEDDWSVDYDYTTPVGYGVVMDSQNAVISARGDRDRSQANWTDRLRLSKHDANGALKWNLVYDDTTAGTLEMLPKALTIATDASDNIFVTGQGGNTVSKYRGTDGVLIWSRPLSVSGASQLPDASGYISPVGGLAVNADGDVVIAGYYIAAPPNSGKRMYLAKLNGATGSTLWTKPDPLAGPESFFTSVVIDPKGDVITNGSRHAGGGAPSLSFVSITQKRSASTGDVIWHQDLAVTRASSYLQHESFVTLDQHGHVVLAGLDQSTASSSKLIHRYRKFASQTGDQLWQFCHSQAHSFDCFFPRAYFALDVLAPRGHYDMSLFVTAGPEKVFHYEAPAGNGKPGFLVDEAGVTVNEGAVASMTGVLVQDAGEIVTLTARKNNAPIGTFTRNELALTWNWTATTTDGPDQGVVTVTADDGISLPAERTFTLTVNNVPPIFSTSNVTLTPAEAVLFSHTITFTDPGTDVWTATVDYGQGAGAESVPVNQAQKSLTLSHPFIGAGPWTVNVTINDGDPGGSTTHSFVVSIGTTRTLNDWRLLHFGTTENTGDAADLATPAKDGIPNLLKFAFNLDPHQSTPLSALPQPSFGSGGGNFMQSAGEAAQNLGPGDSMTFSFTEPAGTTGIIYGAEYSTNLTNWSSITDTGSGGTHTFSVPVTTNTRLFMRLKVTTVP